MIKEIAEKNEEYVWEICIFWIYEFTWKGAFSSSFIYNSPEIPYKLLNLNATSMVRKACTSELLYTLQYRREPTHI